ncbi:hypothetical protein [Agrobacterium pusense]|jgi:hypothetical protein|uniref:hypothetical protein n=1 Tax=Agrobacterium pusense TaxID=648995 RepID=UPI003FD3FE9F
MAKIDIGLRQARRLANLSYEERLGFIAAGLPILLESSRSLYAASQTVSEMTREANVLKGLAEEEAAKILILIDIMRCPRKLVGGRIGAMMGWFYDHLARLLYAEACGWRPINLKELRGIIDQRRVAYYLEGEMGEFIAPNSLIYQRESRLYADIEALDDGTLQWVAPSGYKSFYERTPDALLVAEALSTIGAFSKEGLHIISQVWSDVDFHDETTCHESDRLIEATLRTLIDANLPSELATDDHIQILYAR